MKTFWFSFITEVHYASYNTCWIQFSASLADVKDTSLLKCLCCEMTRVKKEGLHILYVEINTWKSTKNVNNSIWEWLFTNSKTLKWYTPFTDGWTHHEGTDAVASLLYICDDRWNITPKHAVEVDVVSDICHS